MSRTRAEHTMSWGYYGWRPYVPVAERQAKAARELAKLSRKNGHTASPVVLSGRKIASTFWGSAWCDNLEAYSDYQNRLPRGRSYVRNGSVVDLQINKGVVKARVAGSSLYTIQIKIKPLQPCLWKSIQAECAGKIDSLIELLQGKLSSSVMEIVTRRERGLFPTPGEIQLDCSCPDWAELCKHCAASLYGVGARLDQRPELLFLLRGIDPSELLSKASAAEVVRQAPGSNGSAHAMSEADLADVFGIELETQPLSQPPPTEAASTPAAPVENSAPIPPVVAQAKRKPSSRLSAIARARIAAAVKARWARAKAVGENRPARKRQTAGTAVRPRKLTPERR